MFDEQTSALAARIGWGSATACPAMQWQSRVPVAIIGVPPMALAMLGRFKFQAPPSREAPRLKPPILRPWCLNLLWSLEVEVWMFPLSFCNCVFCVISADRLIIRSSRKACPVSHCPSTSLKANKAKRAKKIPQFFQAL
jgi:hypothetical protein